MLFWPGRAMGWLPIKIWTISNRLLPGRAVKKVTDNTQILSWETASHFLNECQDVTEIWWQLSHTDNPLSCNGLVILRLLTDSLTDWLTDRILERKHSRCGIFQPSPAKQQLVVSMEREREVTLLVSCDVTSGLAPGFRQLLGMRGSIDA